MKLKIRNEYKGMYIYNYIMDLKSHITTFIHGLRYIDTDEDQLNYITYKRNLYKLADEFKKLYDLDTCALGYTDLFLRIITDDGIVCVNIHKIK